MTPRGARPERLTAVRHVLAVLGAAIVLATGWLAVIGVAVTRPIQPSTIRHDGGHAYQVRLRFGWPLHAAGDSNDRPRSSRAVLRENGVALGPAHALHDLVRQQGGGRFSHWGRTLYFSAPDNSDPRTNGRRYEVGVVAVLRPGPAALAFTAGAVLLAAAFVGRGGRPARWPPGRLVRLAPGIAGRALLVVASLAVVLGPLELLMRWRRPFAVTSWPIMFDPQTSFRFQPGSTVRWTNNVDFWAETRVNTLGFLDREPPTPRPGDGCRVLFLGDSFVEAAQVPIEQKVHVIFEDLAKARLPHRVDTLALGFSGTGQANQLPYYEVIGRGFTPTVVVLVFVENDFANNSAVLEAVRNGWHPLHPPRLFVHRDARTGSVKRIPITIDWQAHLLATEPDDDGPSRVAATRDWIIGHSVLSRWALTHLGVHYPVLTARLTGKRPLSEILADRMAAIRRLPGFEDVFAGWRFPNDLDYDGMFFATPLPRVFEEALAATETTIDEYLRHARADGFNLVALVSDTMRREFPVRQQYGRQLDGDAYRRRLAAMLEHRQVPLVDVHDHVVRRGGRPADGHFRRDNHWSAQGHRWAAEALLELFERQPGLCRRRR